MINLSVIICSTKPLLSVQIRKNIAETIGDIDYEIIWLDNSQNNRSIFEAYNIGVTKAKGELLCFMHEDVVFHSIKWGNYVCEAFKDTKIGLLGILGGYYVSQYTSGWRVEGHISGEIMHGYTDLSGNYSVSDFDYTPTNVLTDVCAIDGLWMCSRKDLFLNKTLIWDNNTYGGGFHLYDYDLCMQVIKNNMRVCIAHNIKIEHKSPGLKDLRYYESMKAFHKKWDYMLPIVAPGYTLPEDFNELTLLQDSIYNMAKYEESLRMEIKRLNSILEKKPFRVLRYLYKIQSIFR